MKYFAAPLECAQARPQQRPDIHLVKSIRFWVSLNHIGICWQDAALGKAVFRFVKTHRSMRLSGKDFKACEKKENAGKLPEKYPHDRIIIGGNGKCFSFYEEEAL